MSLPNRLTILRMILTVFFVWFLFRPGVGAKVIAAVIFLLASWTDFYDGYYAKKHNFITDFGKIMDPIADKFLILAAFFVFMTMHIVALWMFVIIVIREVGVTVLRLYAMGRGKVLAAEAAGKVKTVLQFTAISLILIFLVFAEAGFQGHWARSFIIQLFQGIQVLMFVVVAVTLFSGISFAWNNRRSLYA